MKPRHVVAHSVWSGGQARGVHGNPTGGRQVFGWVAPASDEPKTVGQERLVVGLQVTIGAQLLPLMTQLVIWATTRLVPMLKRTGDWLKNHHRQIADLAPKILKVALALAGVFSAIKLVNIATSLTTSILGLVATPVGQVVLAVGAVAAAIAGLVAALIYAYHHCREGNKVVHGIMQAWRGPIRLFTVWVPQAAVAGATVCQPAPTPQPAPNPEPTPR